MRNFVCPIREQDKFVFAGLRVVIQAVTEAAAHDSDFQGIEFVCSLSARALNQP